MIFGTAYTGTPVRLSVVLVQLVNVVNYNFKAYRVGCHSFQTRQIISIQPKSLSLPTSIIYQQMSLNKYFKIINGNIGKYYNIGAWNCRRGLLDCENDASHKLAEIKQFLSQQDLHILCVIEADLHGPSSRTRRINPISKSKILSSLKIDGYDIILPKTWEAHGQARILVYVRDYLNVTICPVIRENNDLPIISLSLRTSKKSKKTIISYFYREWTSGVSGLDDMASQKERLVRHIQHWNNLASEGNDIFVLGDVNLCAKNWNDDSFKHKELAQQIHDFLIQTS